MNEDTQSTDTSTDNSSAAIENYDFSLPDGGLSAETDQENAVSSDATADEAAQPDNAEEEAGNQEGESQDAADDPDGISNMSPEERNNFFAQRRIAEKRAGQEADVNFLGQLRDQVRDEFIDVDPDEALFEEMDPQVAEQLRQLRQGERERQAERAIEHISAVRENTRLSILQAEASIPMFNPADAAYNQRLHDMALSNYAHRYLEVKPGPDGEPQVIGAKAGAPSPLEYLQEQAQELGEVLKAERTHGQLSARRNASRADTGSSSGIVAQNSNSAEAIESRIGDIPLDKF